MTSTENRSKLMLLTPGEMGEADRLAIVGGPFDGYGLMENAGAAIAAAILRRFPEAERIAVLCGPGNNGGDGYVVTRLLRQSGCAVRLFALGPPRAGSDAARAAQGIANAEPFDAFDAGDHDLIVDAVFGAGLSKPIEAKLAGIFQSITDRDMTVVAVDLPSGISGKSGQVLGISLAAALTVTFFRKKPGHLLYPGRALCGEVIVADIGIPPGVLESIEPLCFENAPALWHECLPIHDPQTHKYARGAVGIFSGGPSSTGAARLAAAAAMRSGAGAATVLSPPSALLANAAHLTSIMVASIADEAALSAFLSSRKTSALVIGPGFGTGERLRSFAHAILDPALADGEDQRGLKGTVLDADALTEFAEAPDALFAAIAASGQGVVLTPHEGEFARLLPDIAGDETFSKLEKAREAARRSGAVIVLKGADCIIAAPDGRTAINTNGAPVLATAGSGDTLAGIIAGLLAQGMPAWQAACAGVWVHGEAGSAAGFGAMAEDIGASVSEVFVRIA